eukprot:Sspe_Gene.68710::Locus_40511_Transcript_2_2_Confidence_0.667_Length_1857::g.68710::m.68710
MPNQRPKPVDVSSERKTDETPVSTPTSTESLPIVPRRRPNLYNTSGCDEGGAGQIVVLDGMCFKQSLLLTSEWSEQPLSLLKDHIAPRWRTTAACLSFGDDKGRFAEQPADDDLCGVLLFNTNTIFLWPAAGDHVPRHSVLSASSASVFSQCSSEKSSTTPSLFPSAPAASTAGDTDAQSTHQECPEDVQGIIRDLLTNGLMSLESNHDALLLAVYWITPRDLSQLASGLCECIQQVVASPHPQFHAAVAELIAKVKAGETLQALLQAMKAAAAKLLEVPALFAAAYCRMSVADKKEMLRVAASYLLPMADRPKAGLALEACIRHQCSEEAEGGVEVVQPVLDDILSNCEVLMKSGSGNFLVQQCIQLAPSSFADSIAIRIKGKVDSMSMHRHASHAMEQLFAYASPPVLSDLLNELVRSSTSAARLSRSQSGNYVLQAAINRCPASMWASFASKVQAAIYELPLVSAERIRKRLIARSQQLQIPIPEFSTDHVQPIVTFNSPTYTPPSVPASPYSTPGFDQSWGCQTPPSPWMNVTYGWNQCDMNAGMWSS